MSTAAECDPEPQQDREYRLNFYGRKRGALGICYPCQVTVHATSEADARRKVYETHEHISWKAQS